MASELFTHNKSYIHSFSAWKPLSFELCGTTLFFDPRSTAIKTNLNTKPKLNFFGEVRLTPGGGHKTSNAAFCSLQKQKLTICKYF